MYSIGKMFFELAEGFILAIGKMVNDLVNKGDR